MPCPIPYWNDIYIKLSPFTFITVNHLYMLNQASNSMALVRDLSKFSAVKPMPVSGFEWLWLKSLNWQSSAEWSVMRAHARSRGGRDWRSVLAMQTFSPQNSSIHCRWDASINCMCRPQNGGHFVSSLMCLRVWMCRLCILHIPNACTSRTLGSIWIRHRYGAKVSDRCPIDIDPGVSISALNASVMTTAMWALMCSKSPTT